MQTIISQPKLDPWFIVGPSIGLVRWFDVREGKQPIGFICSAFDRPKEEDTFFHINDYRRHVEGTFGTEFSETQSGGSVRIPKQGDVVLYRTKPGKPGKNRKAFPWGYWDDYQAMRSNRRRPLYRVIGHYPSPQDSAKDKGVGMIFWSGIALQIFYLRFPDCREDLSRIRTYFRHTHNVEDIHFEMLPGGQAENDIENSHKWQRWDPSQSNETVESK